MKNLITRSLSRCLISLIVTVPTFLSAQNADDALENGFKNPPESAKPRTWWHWTSSNITKEGITKDLEWMKRAGIGGMQMADVASGQGQTVKEKIIFGSPQWLDAVSHAASEAKRLNLEMTAFSSAGWSLTGGPWVKPEEAMKKLVWSEIRIKGPLNFSENLPLPPSMEGPFGNLPRSANAGPNQPQFYRDSRIIAYPTPASEIAYYNAIPEVTVNSEKIKVDQLFDGDLNTSVRLRASLDTRSLIIRFTYNRPFRAQAFSIASRIGIPFGSLKISNDGINFETIAMMPGPQLYRAGKVETISFPETSAFIYQFEITGAPWRPADVMAETKPVQDSVYGLNELMIHSGARVNRFEDKAGFFHLFDYGSIPTPEASSGSVINPSEIIDITSKMSAEGKLNWTVPAGDWTIMRFGYSLTGSKNRPAVPSGLGYEVDKLSREHTLSYIKQFTGPIAEKLGTLYGTGLKYLLLDSWEAGMQNWTEKMPEEFRRRRGYDIYTYLPVLAGRIVESPETSDRLLWDFRRTLADMFAENHFGVITDYLKKQGLGTYGEVSGVSLEILEDALLNKKYVDIPMGEFWFRSLHPDLMYYQDVRGAASASHVYGKNLVGAESFTGGGFDSPWSLKTIGDYWFAQGINRVIFHTSAHQPLDTKPGNTMVGTHINRNITWAEQALPFMTYLARNSYMLQQGRSVADLVYLLNEGAPSTMPIWGSGLDPAPPEGFDYDYINADALISRLSVASNGHLILPDSVSYTLLVLPNSDRMTLTTLEKLYELVMAGATITGKRPVGMPGLSAIPGADKKFRELVYELWGDLDGVSRTLRFAGKGRVIWGRPVSEVLAMTGTSSDVEFDSSPDTKLAWIHRKTDDADIYFVVNRADTAVSLKMRFRITGREAEIWDPSKGTVIPSGYRFTGNKTSVTLNLNKRQSIFIVFRKKTNVQSREIPVPVHSTLATIEGPWEVSFPKEMGAPEKVTFNKLESWTVNSDDGIKYFSGTAVYTKKFNCDNRWLKENGRILINLGKVGDIATISVNGIPLDLLWDYPFETDITSSIRKGENSIEIKVTNQWTNRLAGDRIVATDKRVLNSPLFVPPGRPLNDSGLLGPVEIILEK